MIFKGPVVGEYLGSRDNNFNLIRMIAASAVLVSHSYPLALGANIEEPLENILGFSLGRIAVFSFFLLSGFLVAASLVNRKNLKAFFKARILRIFPGLIVVVLLSALVLGPVLTSLTPSEYYAQGDTWSYLTRNISLVSLQYTLPGVFDQGMGTPAVNGSLATLPYEFYCYIMVASLLVFGRIGDKVWFWTLTGGLAATQLLVPHVDIHSGLAYRLSLFSQLGLIFNVGVGVFLYRSHIRLNWATAIILGLVSLALHETGLFRASFVLFLGYTLFLLAYLPGGMLRKYNSFGDYSYGMYIYAFPVQQSSVYLLPELTPMALMLFSIPITLLFAWASWHMVEKPMLALKSVPVNNWFQSIRMKGSS